MAGEGEAGPSSNARSAAARGQDKGSKADSGPHSPPQKGAANDGSPASMLKKRTVDADRLRLIREQAQAAYFDVESSQLLPSSSSLAQRQAGMGASQRLNRRDEVLSAREGAGGRGSKAGGTYQKQGLTASQKNEELVAASDKAERLYKAALASEARAILHADEARDPPYDEGEVARRAPAPISLVRPIRLSVHDAEAVTRRAKDARTLLERDAQEAPSTTATAEVSDKDPNESPALSRTTSSPYDSVKPLLTKLPSLHSLRTLRLMRAQFLLQDDDDDNGLDGALLYADSRRSSIAAGQALSPASYSPAVVSGGEDDETWERRGRTRSRRGLVWLDTTKQGDQTARPKLPSAWTADKNEAAGEEQGAANGDASRSEALNDVSMSRRRRAARCAQRKCVIS